MSNERKRMLRMACAVGLMALVALGVTAKVALHRPAEPIRVRTWPNLPLGFEPNVGQASTEAQFVVHAGRTVVLLDSDRLWAAVPGRSGQSHLVRMELIGATKRKGEPQDELPGKANYFIGKDPKAWRTGVRTFARVLFRDVWPGVDLCYHGEGGELEYDFIVHPGASPGSIRLAFDGAPPKEGERGELILDGAEGLVSLKAPRTYQEEGRREVASRYAVSGKQVAFHVSSYDAAKSLVIDPVVNFSTYLGGSAGDSGLGITVDAAGSVYVTGKTNSTNFPTQGPLQATSGGAGDAFVAKLSASGSSLIYSTYLGGSGDDSGSGIAVDAAGSAYVTGQTSSTNFPTQGPLQAAFGGAGDAFVAKLSASGSSLIYSTSLGGSGDDSGYGIAVDVAGSAYVTGDAYSTNFPTQGPFQVASGGGFYDAFAAKLSASGSSLIYSTYLGGSGGDSGLGIAVDAAGNAYVTGTTASPNFPTRGPFQVASGGVYDAFVAKLSATGSSLVYSSYLGGTGDDSGLGIAVDAAGSAYVTGYTSSTDFPIHGPFQATFGGGADAFVVKLSASGSSLIYSTYLGGNGGDYGFAIAVDAAGSAHVTGSTYATNFPTQGPLQPATAGGDGGPLAYDAFISQISGDEGAQDAGPGDAGGAPGARFYLVGCGCNPSGASELPWLLILAATVARSCLRAAARNSRARCPALRSRRGRGG